jgi:Zn2+/Cd2+-exporting ATPase
MKPESHMETCGAAAGAPCAVQIVSEAMKQDPSLKAVKFNRALDSIELARFDHSRNLEVETRITDQIRQLHADGKGASCPFLAGSPDTATCAEALGLKERSAIRIEQTPTAAIISRVTCPTSPRFWHWQTIPWPKVVPREVIPPEEADYESEWKPQLAAALLCGLLGLAGFLARGHPASLLLFGLAYVAGSWFTVHEIWERLKRRRIDVHFLMLAVAIGSASIGAWSEGAILLFLFSFSGALEHYAMGRTQREIRSLFKLAPKTATRLDSTGAEHLVPVEQLQPGMRLLIKPGEQFPVDAELLKGETASDESNLTGEAIPVDKRAGDTVFAGTLNLWGAVEASVFRPAQESALQKIVRLIQEAQHYKAPAQRFTDRFSSVYTWIILTGSALMFFVWWLAMGLEPVTSSAARESAFYRTMTLLVVASPCALVLSIPSAILAAIAWGARRGILFRGGVAVEKLAEIDLVAMDKTGTLTTGELKVERIESFPPGREAEVAQLAFSMERLSTHPLARAVTRHGKQRGLVPLDPDEFESVAGLGLQARFQGKCVRLGRAEWVAGGLGSKVNLGSKIALGSTFAFSKTTGAEPGWSEVWLDAGEFTGRILLRDDIRRESAELTRALRRFGLTTVVLTGDRKSAGEYLKQQLGVDDVRAELKPEQKVDVIRQFIRDGRKPAMIGDGVNDAPSLVAAHVGIAMGARGSDAALEQADVVLMHDRLENFLLAYGLSRRARRIIRQNLVVSLGTVAVLVTLALAGSIPLTIGVIGHEGSTVIVVMNSLRLLFGKAESTSDKSRSGRI